MSYTKGPWERVPETGKDYVYDGGSIKGPGGDGQIVAYGVWHNDSTAGLEIDNPADEALILAAPALLEAAQQVIGTQLQRDNEAAFDALTAAVAQALGEDQG